MTAIDKKLYNYFFDDDANRFTVKKHHMLTVKIWNNNKPICVKCEKPQQILNI